MKRTLLSIVAIMALTLGSFAQLWVQQNTNLAESRGIQDMFAVDANVVWAAAYDGANPTGACNDFCMTNTGGTAWTAGAITGATGLSIANVTAIDANTAWAITYYPAGGTALHGVYKTTNGGTTWAKQPTALFTNAASFPDCVYFWDANTGWCMGDPISGEFEIYTTTDGGTTWTAVPGSQIANPVSGEFGVVGYYSVVGNTVWFGTNKGRIYKSTDQGHNWTASQIPGWTAIYVQPFFKDANFGLSMDKGSTTTVGNLVQTTDGGTTWTVVPPTAGGNFSNDLTYVPGTASTWVVTGADATNSLAGVRYSFDDGTTWGDITETIGTQFLAEAFVNDSTGWAGGFVTSGTGGMFKFVGNLVPPVAAFSAVDTSIVLGGTVTFTNESTGSPTTYLWTFQGGTPGSSTLKNPPAITYNTAGDYNVTLKVTSDFGTNTLVKTGYIHVGNIGINEHSNASIVVFPNPVKDVLNIQASTYVQEVQIINLIGQVVLNQKADSKNITLNTSNLKAGVYNLKVKMDDGFINKKIVVN
jgi:PKD repeat protein